MMHRSNLVSHLDSNNPAVMQRVEAMQHNFVSKGMSADVALKSSYSALDHMVMGQATILSYMDVFLYLGVIFLVCVPFVLMVKGNKGKKVDVGEAMH